MSRRARRWTLLIFVALLLGVGLAWLLWPPSKITAAYAERISVGMTLAEVKAILGGAARMDDSLEMAGASGSSAGIETCYADPWGDLYATSESAFRIRQIGDTDRYWVSKAICVRVTFNTYDTVVKSTTIPMIFRRRVEFVYQRWCNFFKRVLGI